jgi:hypothetical protein
MSSPFTASIHSFFNVSSAKYIDPNERLPRQGCGELFTSQLITSANP